MLPASFPVRLSTVPSGRAVAFGAQFSSEEAGREVGEPQPKPASEASLRGDATLIRLGKWALGLLFSVLGAILAYRGLENKYVREQENAIGVQLSIENPRWQAQEDLRLLEVESQHPARLGFQPSLYREIRRQYRELAHRYHPDVVEGAVRKQLLPAEEQNREIQNRLERFKAISTAYERLKKFYGPGSPFDAA